MRRRAHRLRDIPRARILAIACGREDGDDLDTLRSNPAVKLACPEAPLVRHIAIALMPAGP